MRVPILGSVIDERFLTHRQRSTSIASMTGAAVAGGLFWYRYALDGVWRWDLLAVLITMVVVKWGMMAWYYLTD
ncbi:MAG TPA: hypothetical protein VF387_02220 [Gemmatimonadaceae bacterium]